MQLLDIFAERDAITVVPAARLKSRRIYIMNTRRKLLTAGAAAAFSALPLEAQSDARGTAIYVTGLVWNRALAAPMNDWLIRV